MKAIRHQILEDQKFFALHVAARIQIRQERGHSRAHFYEARRHLRVELNLHLKI
jgi:hypothetical protein